jgi:hypothetical protein
VGHTADVCAALPSGWVDRIRQLARERAEHRELVPTSVTSREDAAVRAVPVLTVAGDEIALELPWLQELYEHLFREIAEAVFAQPVATASVSSYGINLNIQRGSSMRYESHVDSNPISGLLYVTNHPPGCGGELVVANRGDVRGIEHIEQDCSRVHPVAGHLVLFNAQRHSHYVAPLTKAADERIAVVMNFYTAASPESDRPDDLSQHLFGTNPLTSKETQPA